MTHKTMEQSIKSEFFSKEHLQGIELAESIAPPSELSWDGWDEEGNACWEGTDSALKGLAKKLESLGFEPYKEISLELEIGYLRLRRNYFNT